MRQFMLIINKEGSYVDIHGKNRKFNKDEVIHFLRYIANELEEADNNFERFEAILDEDNQRYRGDSVSKQYEVYDETYDKSLLDKTRTAY